MTTNLEDLPVSDGANIRLETREQREMQRLQSAPNMPQSSFTADVKKAAESGALALPSRDIPQTQNHITQDVQATANYVPPAPAPYIEEGEKQVRFEDSEPMNRLDELCDRLQEPILIGIIYFIFQLPAVRASLLRLIPPLFHTDGNANTAGYLFNSILFAGAYYGVTYAIDLMKL